MAQGSMTQRKIYLTVYMRRVHFDPRNGNLGGGAGILFLNGLSLPSKLWKPKEYGPAIAKELNGKIF